MIDSHCHLDFSAFDNDRSQVLQRCKSLGISRIIVPGTQSSTWQQLISLCDSYKELEYTLGIHPFFIKSAMEEDLQTLESLLEKHKHSVKAVGEIGLDFSTDTFKHKQIDFFQKQLYSANKHGLPVILHHRKSHNEIIQILKNTAVEKGGVVHAFSGSYHEACTYIDLGFKLGVGGTITYQRARKTRDVIKRVPIDSILLETDAPDMPIYGRQGQRNSPEFLPEILVVLSSLKSIAESEIAEITTQNSHQLFNLT